MKLKTVSARDLGPRNTAEVKPREPLRDISGMLRGTSVSRILHEAIAAAPFSVRVLHTG